MFFKQRKQLEEVVGKKEENVDAERNIQVRIDNYSDETEDESSDKSSDFEIEKIEETMEDVLQYEDEESTNQENISEKNGFSDSQMKSHWEESHPVYLKDYQLTAFNAQYYLDEMPSNLGESNEWINAMKEELQCINQNKTWSLV